MDTLLPLIAVAFLALAVFLLYSKLRRRRSLRPPARSSSAMPAAPATRNVPATPPRHMTAESLQARQAAIAKENSWALFDPSDRTASIEDEFHAGTRDYDVEGRRAGFTAEQLAAGRTMRKWHPYWKEGLSSFIYHYTDLLDADGTLIAQSLDAEDIRD